MAANETPTNTTEQHTPGPWSYIGNHFKHDDSAIISSADGKPVATALDFNRYDRDAEKEANAHLIAAAPNLLAALKQIYDTHSYWRDDKTSYACDLDLVAAIGKAIAKATGAAQ